jgi:energy-coupling factor transporter ATP-binding protein EcfA2
MEEKLLLALIKQSLPSVSRWFSGKVEEYEHFCTHKFLPYVRSEYNKLDTSTSMLFRNKGFSIHKLYVPLTLVDRKSSISHIVNSFPCELFDNTNKVLINDSAGMGKSTLLKMLFRYSIDDSQYIPFYIDLKSLIDGGSIESVEDHILKIFPSFKHAPSKEFIAHLLEENSYLFLFDGADEVPDKHKETVFQMVNLFASKANKSKFIVASRDEDIILSSFNDFISFGVQQLTEPDAYELLRKYEFKDAIAERLIEELERSENRSVREFLKNPLLTTLLYTAYSFKKKIPLKKSLFYKQIYTALYENHDATKIGYLTREKKSGLDIDDFEVIIGHIAYLSRLHEKLEYSSTELKKLINEVAIQHPTINFNTQGFISDLVSSVPVLRKDGFTYSWQHKSIQEYFFVRYVLLTMSTDKSKALIDKILHSKNSLKFTLVLDIMYDEKEPFFHDTATREIYRRMVKYGIPTSENKLLNSYRLFYVDKNKDGIISNEEFDDLGVSDGLFTEIKDRLIKEFGLEGFLLKAINPSWASFERPESVVFRVLANKNSDLLVGSREMSLELGAEQQLFTAAKPFASYENLKLFFDQFDQKLYALSSSDDEFDLI